MTTQTVTITATVGSDDLAAFLAEDSDLRGSLEARLDEVYASSGYTLTSLCVAEVTING